MTENEERTKKISLMIQDYLSHGFVSDSETMHYLKSACGLTDPDEISFFIENGDDGGAVMDMVSYPSDEFRISIEELIPPEGFTAYGIKSIEDYQFRSSGTRLFMMLGNRKIYMSESDSGFCCKKFIQRLNLNISFSYLQDLNTDSDSINIIQARTCLRKKKFISSDVNYQFINDLIYNYASAGNNSSSGFSDLINFSADMLNGSDSKPLDILSEKKYFYENAITESEEFAKLLKAYTMEFIMMQRIQPPHISIEEARSMVKTIDRLTSIVYGIVIPSVRNVILDSYLE
jgi:hypothetical protein